MLPDNDHSVPLNLQLEVIAWNGRPPGDPVSCILEQRSGSLGRADENDLVLSDQEGVVSRVHGLVEFIDGDYFLVDKSTNGTYVGDANERLGEGQRYRLQDGERFQMGAFTIAVRLFSTSPDAAGGNLHDASRRLIDLNEPQAQPDPFAAAEGSLEPLAERDGWSSDARRPEWFPSGDDNAPADTDEPVAPAERPRASVLDQHMAPPRGVVPEAAPPAPKPPAASDRVPTGYVPFGDQFDGFAPSIFPDELPGAALKPPTPAAAQPTTRPPTDMQPAATPTAPRPPQPAPPPPAAGGDADTPLFDAFLDGLGMPSVRPAPQQAAAFMHQMGELARESAQGLIDILRLRAEFKHEFYVPATSIAPVANNVFKYSVNASEAMSRLASADGREAYLGAAESTRQAFQDLAAHQLALIAGMEAAVDALLQRFSPAALEERIGRATMLEGVMPQVRRARMWEAFEHEYRQIAQQAADDFQQILGQHFARAYAEQIKRLERAGFGGKPEDNE